MTNHSITPPDPELLADLVDSWAVAAMAKQVSQLGYAREIAQKTLEWAAPILRQQGADQELEACLLRVGDGRRENLSQVIALRNARRPKPPSLKEQALEALGPEPMPEPGPTGNTILNVGVIERHRLVRRALEAL